MPVLKPVRGIRLNKSHPLARGLVGYWLLNEGSGNKVFDLSGNGNSLDFNNSPIWSPGKFGSSILFDDGLSQYLEYGSPIVTNYPLTLLVWFNQDAAVNGHLLGSAGVSQDDRYFRIITLDTNNIMLQVRMDDAGHNLTSSSSFALNNWHQAVGVFISTTNRKIYLDGILGGTDTTNAPFPTGLANTTIGRMSRLTPGNYMSGKIGLAMIYNRILSASEIALLYREPFCMVDRAWRPGLIGGQIVELAGTSTALSSLSAIAKASRKVSGTIAGTSDVTAVLSSIRVLRPEIERSWLREALFNGMTANAFKLGTSLSLGWFWVRVTGCSVLYRGAGMGEIDFTNILAVSGQDEYEGSEISPPSYISHNNDSTYFYVVRRFNNCGYQEHTLAATVKVSIGSSGELTEPQPNNIYHSKFEQVSGNKIRLLWFYYPCEQGSRPVGFNVYYDDRTGQIDFENPLATVGYKGRKFYSFQSSALEAGGYLFAIRAEDAGGIENISLARLKIQLDTLNPDAIDILRAEAV